MLIAKTNMMGGDVVRQLEQQHIASAIFSRFLILLTLLRFHTGISDALFPNEWVIFLFYPSLSTDIFITLLEI